mgnify:FL=1
MDNYSIDFLLNIEEVNKIVSIFQNEKAEIRLVGGCVRNALLNKNYKDIDCAVNIHPNDTTKILQKNNIKFQDFAKKYGSVSAFINNKKIEITSLRKDIAQKGRHTDILYTEDWKIDAVRRDFTINALYLTSEGKLIDYFDGLKDLKENKIKFIGNIEKRIKEDFLRIYRYFRFLGIFEEPNVISNYEDILNQYLIESFHYLSNEIIRNEILKMLKNPFPLNSFSNFHNPEKKYYWLEKTTQHFLKQKYQLGIEKCLNKVDEFF